MSADPVSDEAPATKRCRGIGRDEHVLPVGRFRRSRANGDGLQKLCIDCHSAAMRAYRQRLKDRSAADVAARQASGIKTCRRCVSVGRAGERPMSDFYAAQDQPDGKRQHCRHCVRELRWIAWGIVGMTVERYDEMLATQGGRCAIPSCQTPPGDIRRQLDVDHDHATGEARGLLCRNCNVALGKSHESVQILAEMISYLTGDRSAPAVP